MFEPKYTISPQLLRNIKRISVLVAELNHQSLTKVVLLDWEKKAREISAHASTSIEGNPLPLTDVKEILKHRPEFIRDSEREVLNYNQALVELNTLVKESIVHFNLSLILKIQKNVTQDLLSAHRVGALRQEPVFVNDPRLQKTIYWPPDHQDVSELMEQLFDFVECNKSILDPLILAGIFHKQFVVIHPFIDGNGRTVRLATKVLLAGMGLNTFNLFSFENYYNQNVTKYFFTVGVQGNYYDIKNEIDFTSWLEYFTDGIIDELLRVGAGLKKATISPVELLQLHHEKILEHITEHGYITDRLYSQLTDRAKATRNLDFNKLIALGKIVRVGKGRATMYKNK
ncbi:MAG: Fic family protein [Patescibacteria group bacterium]